MALTTGKATDLITFSRGTLATVTDADGKIKWAPHNLLPDSENFDASGWTKYLAPVTANAQVAPNGTTTADTITTSDNYSAIYRSIAVTTGAVYTFGFYAKRGTMTEAKLSVYDVNGAANIVAPTSYYSTINSSTWTLVTQTFTVPAGCSTVNVYMLRDGLTTGTIHLWGASLTRADLGGMQANASAYPMYNPSTPKNLLGYSENFSSWTRSAVLAFGSGSVENAVAAPNGSLTADKIVADTTTGNHGIYQSLTSSATTYTLSVYAKVAEYSLLRVADIAAGGRFYASFDLSSGAVVSGSTGGSLYVSSAISAAGNGWYRCSVTVTFGGVAGTAPSFIGYPSGATLSSTGATYTGDGTSGIYLWGAQLSDSASLDAYVPSFGAAPSAAAYHGPRLDYDPVTLSARGLLVEEARTNLVLRSEEFGNSAWNYQTLRTAQVSADAIAAPSGTTTADKIYEAAAGDGSVLHRIAQNDSSSSAAKVFSVYAKKAERKRIYLFVNGPDDGAWFDLDLGTCGADASYPGGTPSITPVGNGWYRCVLVSGGASTGLLQISIITDAATTNPTRVGDGTSGVYLWGAQLEAGSFATSYIPTAAATVTRNADVASVGVSQFPYSATEGTLVVNYSYLGGKANAYAVALDNGVSLTAFAGLEHPTSKFNTNANSLNISPVLNTTGLNKVAFAQATNDRAVSANGNAANTSTASYTPGVATTLSIGSLAGVPAVYGMSGHIRQITYLPRRLTNAELAARSA